MNRDVDLGRSVIIERVANGFVVFPEMTSGTLSDGSRTFVFKDLDSLKTFLEENFSK